MAKKKKAQKEKVTESEEEMETREICREERVTGKPPAGTITKTLDKNSRESQASKGDK